jgi:predicted aspartyl protease
MRNGLYQKAAAVLQAKNLAHGDREMIETLALMPNQSLISQKGARVQGEIRDSALFAPVLVNGQKEKAQLDTDMGMSIVSDSEARRLKLKVASGMIKTGGASGAEGRGRLGTAEHVEIGGIQLRNVAFGVVSDEQQPFKDLPPGERLVLGLPVILAMGSLRWSHDGTIEIGTRTAGRADPNLCFDKLDPIVRVESQGRNLEMLFDTGSSETVLWPRFLRDFPGVTAGAKKGSNTVTGITGSTEVDSLEFTEIKLRVRGPDVTVKPARVLMRSTMQPSDWAHGWLGFDAMEQGGSVDFRSMIVTIE